MKKQKTLLLGLILAAALLAGFLFFLIPETGAVVDASGRAKVVCKGAYPAYPGPGSSYPALTQVACSYLPLALRMSNTTATPTRTPTPTPTATPTRTPRPYP
jgi:hypothetical protein